MRFPTRRRLQSRQRRKSEGVERSDPEGPLSDMEPSAAQVLPAGLPPGPLLPPESNPETFHELSGSFDLIVNTVSANLDLGQYLSLLRVDGTLVEVGLPEQPMMVTPMPLVGMRRNLSGSMIGGIAETQEMLDFCAEHGVTPEIEVIAPDYINEAYERVVASDVRYRFVIDTGSLAG